MNARTILNGTLSTVLFAWFLAATLPGMNASDLSPFQAYVSTPLLMMAAGIGALALYHALAYAQQWMVSAYARATAPQGSSETRDRQGVLHRWLHPGH